MRRRKRLYISADLMESFLRHPVEPGLVARGFPADGRIVDAEWGGGMSNLIILYVESEQFTDDFENLVVVFGAERRT